MVWGDNFLADCSFLDRFWLAWLRTNLVHLDRLEKLDLVVLDAGGDCVGYDREYCAKVAWEGRGRRSLGGVSTARSEVNSSSKLLTSSRDF